MSDALAVCRALGTTVVEVDAVLPQPVLYDAANDIAFVSAGMDEHEREAAADRLLDRVLTLATTGA